MCVFGCLTSVYLPIYSFTLQCSLHSDQLHTNQLIAVSWQTFREPFLLTFFTTNNLFPLLQSVWTGKVHVHLVFYVDLTLKENIMPIKKNHCYALSSPFLILVNEIGSGMWVLNTSCWTAPQWWLRHHQVMSWTYLTQPIINTCLIHQSQPVYCSLKEYKSAGRDFTLGELERLFLPQFHITDQSNMFTVDLNYQPQCWTKNAVVLTCLLILYHFEKSIL